MPRVSIGLPVYNGEKYLRDALDSLLSQTYEDFELIISDNASTDKTRVICREYTAQDTRIRYYRNDKNYGAIINANKTFQLATGEYFKWATYDDICAPDFIVRCVEVLDSEPTVVLCYPKTILIDENGNEIRKYKDNLDLRFQKPRKRLGRLLTSIRLSNPIYGLIRTSALKSTRLVGEYIASDYILLIELVLKGMFWEVPDYLFFRRRHPNNLTFLPSRKLALWFDPSFNMKFIFPQIKLIQETCNAIKLSNLTKKEKNLCYMQISKWSWWLLKDKVSKTKTKLEMIRQNKFR